MKRFVNGAEVELLDSECEIVESDGRIIVRGKRGARSAIAVRDGETTLVSFQGRQFRVERSPSKGSKKASHAETGEIFAPMPGQIVDVLVNPGDFVVHRQKILVLEAMKTQQAFVAPFDGRIAELDATPGQQVREGDRLVAIEPVPASD